jgi:hypothetical protein
MLRHESSDDASTPLCYGFESRLTLEMIGWRNWLDAMMKPKYKATNEPI